jgi:hypothetical protein
MSTKTPHVSAIVEWDNAVQGGTEQATEAIRAIAAQCSAADFTTELVFVFDNESFDPATVERVVRAVVPDDVAFAVIAHPGSRYYEQKNRGAAAATGEILVFLDSDCPVEPGFLTEIVRTFDDPAVQVVSGTTYTEHTAAVDKAFALTWNFPVRSTDGPTRPTHHFNANGVAFRRTTFERFPFPEDPRFRGQCHSLAEQLTAHGVEILQNPRARVVHPAPRGLGYVTSRALCQGHDRVLTHRQRGADNLLVLSVRVLGDDLRRMARTALRDHRAVGLRWWEVPVVIATAGWYATWSWIGWLVTLVNPTLIRRHLRV